jgi:hypothetical protein
VSIKRKSSPSKLPAGLLYGDTSFKVLLCLVTMARISYGWIIADPNSGQDAPSYTADALELINSGLFAKLNYAPYWPIGYSWFIAGVWSIFGPNSLWLGVVQSLLLSIAIFMFYNFLKFFFIRRTAWIGALILSINLSTFASTTLIMYESPMLSFFMIGSIIILSWAFGLEVWNNYNHLIVGMICLALACLIHPSAIPATISVVCIFVLQCKNQGKNRLFLFMPLIIAIGPIMQLVRNYVVEKSWGFTSNATANMLMAGWGNNDKQALKSCLQNGTEYWDSAQKSICLVLTTIKDPRYFLEVIFENLERWFSPYIGIMKTNGTWYHAFDWRRLFDNYEWWSEEKTFDYILSASWSISILVLSIFGLFRISSSLLNSTLKRPICLSILAPYLSTITLSLLTFADNRHRILMAPLVSLTLAITLNYLILSLSKKRKRLAEQRIV